MARLIKNVSGSILDNYIGTIYLYGKIEGNIQTEDYINLNRFIAYLQNFTRVWYYESLPKPLSFGLKNQFNLPTTTLEISY